VTSERQETCTERGTHPGGSNKLKTCNTDMKMEQNNLRGSNMPGYVVSCSWHLARMGEKRNVYRLLVGKPEGKRPLGRPRCRWIDNIKMDLLKIGLSVVDWIGLAQDTYRVESSCERGNEPSSSIKCWETTEWLHKLWPLAWYSAPQS
jgi:hypothetical protein